MKPWNHGMLGFGSMGLKYKQEMPMALRDEFGYSTAVIGKNHFGYNKTSKKV
jgi:hypothetical protein